MSGMKDTTLVCFEVFGKVNEAGNKLTSLKGLSEAILGKCKSRKQTKVEDKSLMKACIAVSKFMNLVTFRIHIDFEANKNETAIKHLA